MAKASDWPNGLRSSKNLSIRFRIVVCVVAGLFISCQGGTAALPAQQPAKANSPSPPESENGSVSDAEPEPADDSEKTTETQEAELLPNVRQAVVEQTNDFRQRNNQQPLSSNEQLTKAAEAFAKFMAINDKYGHRADDRTPAERAKASGYEYCVVRENIAFRRNPSLEERRKLVETFVQGWIDSDEHRANMLADYVTETGVAIATTDQSTFYAVQMFGRPESLRFQVELTNRTEEMQELTLEHQGNADSFELPPKIRLKVTRCLPTNFTLHQGEQTLTLQESAELAIVINSDNEAELQRSEKPSEE